MDIINNVNKAPSEIRINNLRNNESININAESVNNEESIREIEEKLKSWIDEMAREKLIKPAKSEIKNNKADIVISNNIDLKEDNNKIVDFVNDMEKLPMIQNLIIKKSLRYQQSQLLKLFMKPRKFLVI